MPAIYTRCCTRGEFQECIYDIYLRQVQIRLPTLALKPRGDVTISPKQVSVTLKNGHVSNNFFLKKKGKLKASMHTVKFKVD